MSQNLKDYYRKIFEIADLYGSTNSCLPYSVNYQRDPDIDEIDY